MKKKSSLGRGLAAILGHQTNTIKNTENKIIQSSIIKELDPSQIEINPFQPRKDFNQESLYELSISIEKLGVIQPITVRRLSEKKYQIISGERRLRAAKLAEINKIPAFVRTANDQQMLEMALVENIQREDLNPIEVALSYRRLIKECNLTQEACSERVGKNRSTITNFLRLLKLPMIIQKGLSEKKISTGHARSLINLKSEETQLNIYYDIVDNGYSVREVEEIAKTFSTSKYKRIKKGVTSQTPHPFSHQKIIHDLTKDLNVSVEMKRNKKGKGKIIIPFNTDDEFFRLSTIIKK